MPAFTDLDLQGLFAVYGGADGRWATTMIALTLLGGGWSALLLVPMLLHRRTRGFASPLALAIVGQAIVVWALKAAVGRVRPWIAFGWPAPLGAPHDPSFPSGHAAGSFCVAAFLAVALPAVWAARPAVVRAVTAGGLVVAALVATSRVYLGAHFPADVAMGALLGAGIGVVAGRGYVRTRAG